MAAIHLLLKARWIFFIIHLVSDEAWMADHLFGTKDPSCSLWGVNSRWLCAFSFRLPRRAQAPASPPAAGYHPASARRQPQRHAGDPVQRSAPEARPLRGEVPYVLHTHHVSTFQQYRLLAPRKQPRVEGDFVFTTPDQCCDARLLKTFLCSDEVCLPTKDYETTFNQRAPSLTRPSSTSEGRAEPCS